MDTDVELIPVVYWITRRPETGYSETLNEVMRSLRPFARSRLRRDAPPDRGGLDAEALIYDVLLELQRLILDQYLPEVESNRVKSFASLWPWWDRGAMKVRVADVVQAVPIPAEDGAVHSLEERGWSYRVYRTDTPQQRLRWIFHRIKERTRKEKRALSDDLPLDHDVPAGNAPAAKRGAFGDESDFRDLLSITDPEDWRDARARGDAKTRKRCQRATRRLVAGFKILELSITQSFAKAYVKRLIEAQGKERQSILNDFLRRYMREEKQ